MRLRGFLLALLLALCAGAATIAQQSTTTTGTFTGVERRITTDLADQFDPVISGDLIVYTDNRGTDLDVYYFDMAAGVETAVTGPGGHEQLTDVSNGLIVYNLLSSYDVVLYNTANGLMTNLTADTALASYNPAIGQSIVAWETTVEGNREVFARNLESGEVRNISNSPERVRRTRCRGRRDRLAGLRGTFWRHLGIRLGDSYGVSNSQHRGRRAPA